MSTQSVKLLKPQEKTKIVACQETQSVLERRQNLDTEGHLHRCCLETKK